MKTHNSVEVELKRIIIPITQIAFKASLSSFSDRECDTKDLLQKKANLICVSHVKHKRDNILVSSLNPNQTTYKIL